MLLQLLTLSTQSVNFLGSPHQSRHHPWSFFMKSDLISMSRSQGRRLANLLLLAAASALPLAARAADVVVRITGLSEPLGQVGCSLFAGPAGFPMDNAGARQMWQAADAKGVTCRYTDVPEGTYAVAIGHDLNGNKRVDTNFIGMPTEQWGTSNNARPSLRAPRFDEALFKVAADAKEVVIDIKVAK
jgi:uncharacterized protein (DUF2141 family)